jgi:hypothetical protein
LSPKKAIHSFSSNIAVKYKNIVDVNETINNPKVGFFNKIPHVKNNNEE